MRRALLAVPVLVAGIAAGSLAGGAPVSAGPPPRTVLTGWATGAAQPLPGGLGPVPASVPGPVASPPPAHAVPVTTVATPTQAHTTAPPGTPTTTAPTPPAVFRRSGVSLREYDLIVAHPTLEAGTVRLNGIDDGMDEHDLTVAQDGVVLGQTPRIAAGGEAELTLDLAPGTYRLYCSLYDHDALGMHATLTVR